MHKRLAVAASILGAAVMLAACGSTDVCQHGVDATTSLNGKITNCPNESTSSFDKSTCDQVVTACSDSDKDKLNNYFDCLQGVQACVSGQESTFDAAIETCAANSLQGMSQTCAGAFFG